MGERYFCNSCHYKWESKKSFGEPSICPKCKKDSIIEYSKTKGYEKEVQEEKDERKMFMKDLRILLKKEEEKINNKWFWSKKKKEDKIKEMKLNPFNYFVFRIGPVNEDAEKLQKKYNGSWYR